MHNSGLPIRGSVRAAGGDVDALCPEGRGLTFPGFVNPEFGTIYEPLSAASRGVPSRRRSKKERGTNVAYKKVCERQSNATAKRLHPERMPYKTDRGENLNKRAGVKKPKKRRVLLRLSLNQPIERFRQNHARHEIGMGIFWLALATICGALGWVLLSILLK
jgi:hypothetical protein